MPNCPICDEEFENDTDLVKHSETHTVIEAYSRLNSRLDAITSSLGKTMAEMMEKFGTMVDARFRRLEERIETRGEPEEILMGEKARESYARGETVKRIAEGLEQRGWSRKEISDLLGAAGPFLQGLGAFIQATRGGPSAPTPYEEIGRRTVEASGKIMDAVYAEIGKRIGREVLRPEHE